MTKMNPKFEVIHRTQKLLLVTEDKDQFERTWASKAIGTCTLTHYSVYDVPGSLLIYEIWGVENPEMESELADI